MTENTNAVQRGLRKLMAIDPKTLTPIRRMELEETISDLKESLYIMDDVDSGEILEWVIN